MSRVLLLLLLLLLCFTCQLKAALVYQATLQDNAASTTIVAATGTDGNMASSVNTSVLSELAGPGGSYPRALHFDGASHVAVLGTDANFPDAAEERTICFWFNADAFDTGVADAMVYYISAGTGEQFIIYAEDQAVSVGFSGHRVITPKATLSTGTWYHVAVVVPSGATTTGEVDVYIDGVNQTLSNETGSSVTLNTATPNVLLARDGASAWYDGYLADFRIYSSDESANLSTIIADGQDSSGPAINPISDSIPGSAVNPIRNTIP